MKKIIGIIILVTILVTALTVGTLKYLESRIEITSSDNEEITDQDILDFLKEKNVIKQNDVYKDFHRDVGILGTAGNPYYYIYEREDGSYYYVLVEEYSPRNDTNDIDIEYTYKANETYYQIYIQDCIYNEDAEYVDERITEVFGNTIKYIVTGEKGNFELIS